MTPHTIQDMPVLATVKAEVNAYLKTYLTSQITRAQAVDQAYVRLWSEITSYMLQGGKRFRPYMTLLAYGAYADTFRREAVFPAAIAQELLHQATLIHDDMIDRDTIRHGTLNIMGAYEQHYIQEGLQPTEARHFANSAALLAGDVLLSASHELIGQCEIDQSTMIQAQRTLHEALFTVVGGELIDTESSFVSEPASPLHIAHHKTASYSFVGPLQMGALIAQASSSAIESLRHFGTALGVAFQLQDDILGIFGTEDQTGKSVSSDIREGKRTYLIETFFSLASGEDKALFVTTFGNPEASDAAVAHIRALLESSGAKAAVQNEITLQADRATQYLSSMQLDPKYHAAFTDLITLCTKREA